MDHKIEGYTVSASGDSQYPFCVCPVIDDGMELPPIAGFERHADALLFLVAKNKELRT